MFTGVRGDTVVPLPPITYFRINVLQQFSQSIGATDLLFAETVYSSLVRRGVISVAVGDTERPRAAVMHVPYTG
jgi:hypothetical protein